MAFIVRQQETGSIELKVILTSYDDKVVWQFLIEFWYSSAKVVEESRSKLENGRKKRCIIEVREKEVPTILLVILLSRIFDE